jgi:hypothetical protein
MVMIVVAIAMAPRPRVFQVTTAAFGLPAVIPMLAFRIVQFSLRGADSVLAFPVIVTVNCPRRHRSAQERQNDKCRNQGLSLVKHASSS